VHLFQLNIWQLRGQHWDNPFYSTNGLALAEPRMPVSVTNMATWLAEQDPQARFMIRFGAHPPPEWRREHLDDYAPLLRKGAGMPDGRSILPSLASDGFREGVARLVRDVVAWCEKQPWRDRIVGYSLFPYGEGATEVGCEGDLFDTSPVMQAAFRAFLRTKYGNDEALQRAWRIPEARIETAAVPTKEEWLEKRRTLGLLHWPDPAQVRRERDYFLLQKEVFHRFWGGCSTPWRRRPPRGPASRAMTFSSSTCRAGC